MTIESYLVIFPLSPLTFQPYDENSVSVINDSVYSRVTLETTIKTLQM